MFRLILDSLLRLVLDARSMRELSVVEQRDQAVMAVIGDGLSVSQVAEKVGVSGNEANAPCAGAPVAEVFRS